jgi:hypothetical protein
MGALRLGGCGPPEIARIGFDNQNPHDTAPGAIGQPAENN